MAKPSGKKRSLSEFLGHEDTKLSSTLQFEVLPNEVIFCVFSYLTIVDLLKCGQVSKRFRAISINENLWPKKLNLCHKKVPVGFLQKLLDSGCKYLSLSGVLIEGALNLAHASRLKYLNLSGFGLNCYCENSTRMLESCYSLQKLSLSKICLPLKLISIVSFQNGKTLKVLDLSKCIFLTVRRNGTYTHNDDSSKCELTCIQLIVENCTELEELSLNMTKLCERSVDFLVSNLTTTIEKLDLFDQTFLRDKHVKKLVTRCNKITELNFGGWTSITRHSLNYIIENLKSTLVKLNLEFTKVNFHPLDLFQLKSIEKLKILCYELDYEVHNDLMQQMPSLAIASNMESSSIIAIPCHPGNNHRHGFWEIKAEQEKLFKDDIRNSKFAKLPCLEPVIL